MGVKYVLFGQKALLASEVKDRLVTKLKDPIREGSVSQHIHVY